MSQHLCFQEQKELAALFKPVIIQKIEAGTDPKSVLCAYFKQGQCTKGDKCKFSHDPTIERKTEKRSMYVDVRDVEADGETMESWDDTKLKEVVDKKHAAEKTNATTIICKYFLEAVEKSLYGWFWECTNGSKCIYRHALPPGYVLKKDKKKDDKTNEISLEELIETERSALGANTTKVTLESFLSWKKRKIEEKKAAQLEEEKKKLKDFKSGKQFGISGREMFSFNPDLVYDNSMEDDEQTFDIVREKDENEDDFKEVDFSAYNMGLKEVRNLLLCKNQFALARISFRSMELAQSQPMIVLISSKNPCLPLRKHLPPMPTDSPKLLELLSKTKLVPSTRIYSWMKILRDLMTN